MIKRILFLFMISLFLVSCEAVESTPAIETPVESTEPVNEPLPVPKEIDMINYTYYHQFVTVEDEVVQFNLSTYRLGFLLGLIDFQERIDYLKPYIDYIEIDFDILGNHQNRGTFTYFPIGQLDDFIVYNNLLLLSHFEPQTVYVTQAHRYKSSQFNHPLIFIREDKMYHLNEMVEDMGYDIHILAHIFDLRKYRIEPFEQVDLELSEGVAINYEHVFFLDGEHYTLGQARASNNFDDELIIELLPDTQIMTEELLFLGPIEHPYFAKVYYGSYIFISPVPLGTKHYRHYVFDLEGYAYYYKTRVALTRYYVLYNEIIYTIEDVLTQDLLTFEELTVLIGLNREKVVTD